MAFFFALTLPALLERFACARASPLAATHAACHSTPRGGRRTRMSFGSRSAS